MPYFLYKVFPGKRFEPMSEFPKYRDARDQARTLRADLPKDAEYTIRVIFAKNHEEAELIMAEPREARPLGEDA